MNRIALFGGSFDPVHVGHLWVAQAALEELALDRLFFIPASQSPFKPGTAPTPPSLRVQMLRRAMVGVTRFEIDLQEIQRGGVSYSIESVREHQKRHPQAQLFYLIGADHLPTLPQWREAPALAQLVEFIVIPRPGQAPVLFPDGFRGRVLKGFPAAISASEIRQRVQQGKWFEGLVPPGVSEIIRNNHLYL